MKNDAAPIGKHEPSWVPITDSDTLHLVRQQEAEFDALIADEYEQFFIGPWYQCTHCRRGALTPVELFEHSKWA